MPRIILVRHGRSAHAHGGWHDRPGLDAWFAAYDAAGLAAGESPPPEVRELARHARLVVSSDIRRAVESAALLTGGVGVHVSPLLRETTLPIPSLGRVRLPFLAWGLLIGAAWGRSLRREAVHAGTHSRSRGREAAGWLAELAHAHDSVLAVTHGVMRRYVADALEADGWRHANGRRRSHPWSAWELERPAVR